MGVGRLIQRALTPAPFVGSGDDGTITVAGRVANALPAGYIGASAAAVAAPDVAGAVFGQGGEAAVRGLSAGWRCLHVLTDGIAALEMYGYDDRARDARIDTPRVLADPWPMVTPVEWRAMVVASLVLHGNAFLLPYDEDPRTGYPRQLPIVHPDRVLIKLVDGRPRYFLDDYSTEIEVLHIRGYLPPGHVKGVGIIEAHRRGIHLATTLDTYQVSQLADSSVPPVVIRVNRPEISQEQASDIQMRWMARHGYSSRVPAVIPTSMEVTPIAWSPEDAQFLESKQYAAVEICWWFGIDPRVLGLSASGQSLTYANIETTYVDLQRMSFLPWTSRIEAALSRVLPRGISAKFDFAPMLRTTLQDRFQSYAIALENGWMTVDEVRALENMGPLATADSDPAHRRTGGVATQPNANPTLPVPEDMEVVL